MDTSGFLIGLLTAVIVIGAALQWRFSDPETLTMFWDLVLRRRKLIPEPPPVVPEALPPPPAPPPPVVVLPDLSPNYGNVRPVGSEWNATPPDPEISTDAHVFPERKAAITPYEEFNWKLFLVTGETALLHVWPETLVQDFAPIIRVPAKTAFAEARKRLRPHYPVIFDWTGNWAVAAARLERDPAYTDPVISAYMSIPQERRPVVVSVISPEKENANVLTCMRYGFADYTFDTGFLQPYTHDGLVYLMSALSGSKEQWLWFSRARLRKAVLEDNRKQESVRNFLEAEVAEQKKIEHTNRFNALWDLRGTNKREVAVTGATPKASAGSER